MEREVRHPLLFTLCGFVLCIMFAGNLARAQEPQRIVLDMSMIQEYEMYGYVLVYKSPLDKESTSSFRVFQGRQGEISVLPGEWISVNMVQISTIWRCKNVSNEHRLLVGQDELSTSARIMPRLVIDEGRGSCRLSLAPLPPYAS